MCARAVFLDRDGVINAVRLQGGRPHPPQALEEFCLLPGVVEACNLLRDAGFLLVVATNQPDVGRGAQDRAVVESMHKVMCEKLPINRIEVCYDGGEQFSEYRKPEPGMLLRAASELRIELSQSYMVGDRWRDIDCGYAAGCTTIFIDYGYNEPLRRHPDFVVPDLLTAATMIVSKRGG